MANDVKIQAVISAKDNASKVFKSFSEKHSGLVRGIKIGAAAAGAAVIGVGVASVKMASDFSKSMANVSTLVDTGTEDMDKMKKSVLEISKRTPVALDDLTSALYDVRSAGIAAEDAMMVLEKSAQLGVAGLGTTAEAVDIATSAINSFNLSGEEATKVFDIIQLTVKSGKTNINELSTAFGNVAGTAASAGIRVDEMMAATAALTTTGLKASVAQTQLRSAIIALQAPTETMADLISKAGFESGETMLKEIGLVESMEKVTEASGGSAEAMRKAFGSVEALGAAVSLTGNQSEAFSKIMEEMKGPTDALSEAFEKQKKEASAQYQLLKNNLGAVMIDIGNKILPTLIKGMEWISSLFDIGTTQGEFFMTVVDAIGLSFQSLWKILTAVGKSLMFVIDKSKSAYEWVSKTTKQAKDITTGGWRGEKNIPFLPFFADGGVVPGSGPIPIIAHGGEVVLNKDQQESLLNKKKEPTTINYNFSFGNVSGNTDELTKKIINAINRASELKQFGGV